LALRDKRKNKTHKPATIDTKAILGTNHQSRNEGDEQRDGRDKGKREEGEEREKEREAPIAVKNKPLVCGGCRRKMMRE
jgi:hypothetical protein